MLWLVPSHAMAGADALQRASSRHPMAALAGRAREPYPGQCVMWWRSHTGTYYQPKPGHARGPLDPRPDTRQYVGATAADCVCQCAYPCLS